MAYTYIYICILGYVETREKKMETTIMGYTAFRVQGHALCLCKLKLLGGSGGLSK